MTSSVSNNCTKNYSNRTLTVQVIVEDVVTWIFLRHSVYKRQFYSVINTRCYMNENETTASEMAIHRQDSYNRKLNQFHVCSMH